MKKSLFKNTIYKAILSFVNIVIPLLVGPYVVKLLDVDLYGIYNTVYAEFQVFLIFASFGLYTFGMREISKIRDDKKKVSELFSNIFLISIISNTVVCLVYLLYAFFTSSGTALLLYCIMTIQIVGNVFYIEFVNEALENYKFITIKTTIVKIIYLVAIFLFLKKPNDVAIYAVIVSLVVFANNIISFIYAKKYIKFDFKNIKIKKYIGTLITILIITNIELLYSQLDRVMLGKFVNGVAVSMYYIPYYLISTLAAVPYSIINVSIPRLSYVIANESKENYMNSLNKIISSLLFIIVPMCMGVFALSYEVIYLYAGNEYLACVPALMITCINRIFLCTESVLTHLVMYPNNQEKTLLKFSFGCGVLNLILNSLLVAFKILSPLTAMFTTLIAEIALISIEYIYINKKLDIKPKFMSKQNLIYFVLSILFIPVAVLIKFINFGFYINIILIIFICVALYGGILLLIKDENLMLIMNKIFNLVRRKKHG